MARATFQARRKIARAIDSSARVNCHAPHWRGRIDFRRRRDENESRTTTIDSISAISNSSNCAWRTSLSTAQDEAMPSAMSPEDRMKQRLLYNILLSILERAYLRYQLEELDDRRSQWAGWDEDATRFLTRPSFRELWSEQGGDYDSYFQDYMNAKIRKHERELTRNLGNTDKWRPLTLVTYSTQQLTR